MSTFIDFSPGPSRVYFTLEMHMRNALKEGTPSVYHRSKTFESIYQHTVEQLRALLGIPLAHHIFFVSSATEVWERLIQNVVDRTSFHLVNGAFSNRFYETAVDLKKQADKIVAPDGGGFSVAPTTDAELISIAHNETSTGAMHDKQFIYALKEKNPNAIVAVDMVSSAPYADLDYNKIDSAYFSVQKGFGLFPGLGVWIVNDQCMAKAEALAAQGKSIGAHHSLLSLRAYGAKNQTPHTPNTLAIYLLGKVAEDMCRKGIAAIRRETDYKASLMYETLKKHPKIGPFVSNSEFQSPTSIVVKTEEHTAALDRLLKSKGIVVGDGYGGYSGRHMRIANFPTHSKEQFELLADLIQTL